MKAFKKGLAILMIVVLALAMTGLHMVRKTNEHRQAEILQAEQEDIRALETEKSQLQSKLVNIKNGTAETADAGQQEKPRQAVLCVTNITETFYKEIFPVMQEKGQMGVVVLSNGSLPGDSGNDMISAQSFFEMMEAGWSYAITVTKYSGNSTDDWKATIDTYMKQLSTRVGVMPTAYCFVNGANEERIHILKEKGFTAILSREAVKATDMLGIQLVPYGSNSLEEYISQINGCCGVEVYAYWQDGADETLQYSEDTMLQVLENPNIDFVGLDQLEPATAENGTGDGQYVTEEQIQARIAEIDAEISQLYQ